MRRVWICVGLVVGVASLCISHGLANERIEPFGELRWEDTLVDVVMKLNNMGTIQEVSLRHEEYGSLDISGLHVKKAILAKIGHFLTQSRTQSEGDQPTHIFKDTLIVSAGPIWFFDVVFSLHIAYSPALDMMRDHAENVLTISKGKEHLFLPLRMMHVVLSKSHTSLLDAKTLRRLQAAMAEKYRACAMFRTDDEEMFARDKAGRAFLARWKDAESFRHIEPGYTGSGLLQYRNR